MAKSILDNQKKKGRGRPRTGTTPMTGVRFSAGLLEEIEKWARSQPDKPNKAEAIRRLVEQALGSKNSPRRPAKEGSHRAASDLASREIEHLGDKSQPNEEQQRRKRTLIHGPKEFREIRGDQPKKGGR